MKLSFAALYDLATVAGFPDPATAAAISLAESSGNPTAHNPVPPDDSYGLWQINMLGRLGPERRAQWGLRSNSDLFDPGTNADAAFALFQQSGSFRPWSTYGSGAYRRFLQPYNGGGVAPQWGGVEPIVDPIANGGGYDDVLPVDYYGSSSSIGALPLLLIAAAAALLLLALNR